MVQIDTIQRVFFGLHAAGFLLLSVLLATFVFSSLRRHALVIAFLVVCLLAQAASEIPFAFDVWKAMIPATPTGSNIAAGGKEVTACMVNAILSSFLWTTVPAFALSFTAEMLLVVRSVVQAGSDDEAHFEASERRRKWSSGALCALPFVASVPPFVLATMQAKAQGVRADPFKCSIPDRVANDVQAYIVVGALGGAVLLAYATGHYFVKLHRATKVETSRAVDVVFIVRLAVLAFVSGSGGIGVVCFGLLGLDRRDAWCLDIYWGAMPIMCGLLFIGRDTFTARRSFPCFKHRARWTPPKPSYAAKNLNTLSISTFAPTFRASVLRSPASPCSFTLPSPRLKRTTTNSSQTALVDPPPSLPARSPRVQRMSQTSLGSALRYYSSPDSFSRRSRSSTLTGQARSRASTRTARSWTHSSIPPSPRIPPAPNSVLSSSTTPSFALHSFPPPPNRTNPPIPRPPPSPLRAAGQALPSPTTPTRVQSTITNSTHLSFTTVGNSRVFSMLSQLSPSTSESFAHPSQSVEPLRIRQGIPPGVEPLSIDVGSSLPLVRGQGARAFASGEAAEGAAKRELGLPGNPRPNRSSPV